MIGGRGGDRRGGNVGGLIGGLSWGWSSWSNQCWSKQRWWEGSHPGMIWLSQEEEYMLMDDIIDDIIKVDDDVVDSLHMDLHCTCMVLVVPLTFTTTLLLFDGCRAFLACVVAVMLTTCCCCDVFFITLGSSSFYTRLWWFQCCCYGGVVFVVGGVVVFLPTHPPIHTTRHI